MAGSVSLRVIESYCRNIGGDNPRVGQFLCQRDRDAAGTRSQIRNSQRLCPSAAAPFQRNFDHVFGFWPGDQHTRAYCEFEPPKFLAAREVLSGQAFAAALDQLRISCCGLSAQFVFGVGIKPGAVPLQNMHQQQLRGEKCRRNIAHLQPCDAAP